MSEIAEIFDVFFNRRPASKGAVKSCTWTPVVYKSRRVSTLFVTTSCGYDVAKPTDALFCHKCGGRLTDVPK